MQKRRIDFEKFEKWLKEQAQTASRIVDEQVAKEHYFDAAEMSAEANTYEFISVLLNEVPAELPDFVIVEEKNCEACGYEIRSEVINNLNSCYDCPKISFCPTRQLMLVFKRLIDELFEEAAR